MHDEFHRRVIVVQKQHFIERRFFRLGPGPGDNPGLPIVLMFVAVSHEPDYISRFARNGRVENADDRGCMQCRFNAEK
jgi:hypothetical protein